MERKKQVEKEVQAYESANEKRIENNYEEVGEIMYIQKWMRTSGGGRGMVVISVVLKNGSGNWCILLFSAN